MSSTYRKFKKLIEQYLMDEGEKERSEIEEELYDLYCDDKLDGREYDELLAMFDDWFFKL